VVRLRFVFLCVIVLVLAGSLLSFRQYRNVSAYATRAADSERNLSNTVRLNNLLLSLMARLHRAAETRSAAEFDSGAKRLLEEFRSQSGELIRAIGEIPEQDERHTILVSSIIHLATDLPQRVSSMSALAQNDDWDALHARLLNQADETDDVVAALMSRLEKDLTEARATLGEVLRTSQERALSTLLLTAVLSVGIALTLSTVVTRSVTHPLAKLASGARALASGDLDHRIEDRGEDELADLARAFNHMADEIQRLMMETRSAHALAEQAQEQALERARELGRANQDLQQFAYSASHDLQEPLRVISLYSDLLQRRAPPEGNPEVIRCVQTISTASLQMQQLIADLLAYTRAGAIVAGAAPRTDLNFVLQRVTSMLQVQIESLHCTIAAQALPIVRAHEVHVQQVLQNLISNAMKYRSADRNPRIEIGAVREGAWWEVWVHDNGMGIAPEYREQIFGLFKRLHGRQYPGTGIGLAICRRIVEGYTGRMWVDSVPGHSSTFRFTLPATTEPEPTEDC
jgi:signal transduction histidine kinase